MPTAPAATTNLSLSLSTMRLSPLLLTFLMLLPSGSGCSEGPDPQAIVDRAIAAHGGAHLDEAVVEFDFRDRHYRVMRDGGLFQYERHYTDSTGADVREVLTNDELYREVDGRRVSLSEAEAGSVLEGVNSVVYFALLPYFLNDPAVQKRYLGETTLRGEPYHEIEITFRQEGGGVDYEDRFVYWIHQENHTMDYLAYRFHVNGGGTRFREAVNPRRVGGVRFADYRNFTPAVADTVLEGYDTYLDTDTLRLLSNVEIENVRVRPLPAGAS